MHPTVTEQIEKIRDKLDGSITIMAHHYQHDEVVRHAQIVGDSLELAQKVSGVETENIVFCGVNFMAESAALLARPGQKVYLSAADANCVMASMVPAMLLDSVLQKLKEKDAHVLPLAYVNTSFAVKAVVGKHGGAVCTSSNAERMMRWAYENSDTVLFLPDRNLGNNTAELLGISDDARLLLDIRARGNNIEKISPDKKLLLWPGRCAIHARFHNSDIDALRTEHPSIKIIVHPECAPELVQSSDASGSTSFIIKYAAAIPDGNTLGIGTEINLVERLAKQHAGRIKIFPLLPSSCSDMAKTTPEVLYRVLRGLAEKKPVDPHITVSTDLAPHAKMALTRMLEVCN